MRIKTKHLYAPKSIFGVKRVLLALNRDLDHVKRDINFNGDFGFAISHSISKHNATLTNVEVATLFLEDRRFFSHSGFEFISLLRTLKRYLLRGSFGGMSTIDQQVVRVSLDRYERTFYRKINEIALAIFLNSHVSKRNIFDYYLHNAYTGYKMEGCEIAARKVFHTPASKLTKNQAAFIASLFPLPFPRSVWEVYSIDPNYPFSDPLKIIELGKSCAPRWASRVGYRMNIALTAYDRMPNSL